MSSKRIVSIIKFSALSLFATAQISLSVGAKQEELIGYCPQYKGVKAPQEQILVRRGYIASYNRATMQPNWVMWVLTNDETYGTSKRPKTAFHEDIEVPMPRAQHYDYKQSGWDRGHMCPAGDMKWDNEAMYETFLMSNICPQAHKLNSGVWNQIETKCRKWTRKYGDLVIITGPIFTNSKHQRIGQNRIPVPEAFFKVILCHNASMPWAIGYICPNSNTETIENGESTSGQKQKKTEAFIQTVDNVERITQYDFFSEIDDEIETRIESRIPDFLITKNEKKSKKSRVVR